MSYKPPAVKPSILASKKFYLSGEKTDSGVSSAFFEVSEYGNVAFKYWVNDPRDDGKAPASIPMSPLHFSTFMEAALEINENEHTQFKMRLFSGRENEVETGVIIFEKDPNTRVRSLKVKDIRNKRVGKAFSIVAHPSMQLIIRDGDDELYNRVITRGYLTAIRNLAIKLLPDFPKSNDNKGGGGKGQSHSKSESGYNDFDDDIPF